MNCLEQPSQREAPRDRDSREYAAQEQVVADRYAATKSREDRDRRQKREQADGDVRDRLEQRQSYLSASRQT